MLKVPTESWITPKAAKGVPVPGGRLGAGLQAVAPIRAGELVAIKGGVLMTLEQFRASEAFPRHTECQIDDQFVVAARTLEQVESSMIYINHSCDPNTEIRDWINLHARRDIQKGEFLTADFGVCMAYPGFELDDCACETELCRGRITNRDWLIPGLRERYGDGFPPFLAQKLANLEAGKELVEDWIERRLDVWQISGAERWEWWERADIGAAFRRRGGEERIAVSRRYLLDSFDFALLAMRSPKLYCDPNGGVDFESLMVARFFQEGLDNEIERGVLREHRRPRQHLTSPDGRWVTFQMSPGDSAPLALAL